MPCPKQCFTKIAKTQFEKFSGFQIYIVIIYAKMVSKLYRVISNKLWDLSLYFGDRYNTWVLASQQNALGPCKCARFRAKQTYRNYSFSCLLTFVSVYKSFSRKKHFLKNSWFFSFKLFQSHNWLTNYPDSKFHGHWKTVTLSSISPNLSKHWRF